MGPVKGRTPSLSCIRAAVLVDLKWVELSLMQAYCYSLPWMNVRICS